MFDEAQRGIFFDCKQVSELEQLLVNINKNDSASKFISLLSLLNIMSATEYKSMLSSSDYNMERSDKTEHRITKVCRFIQEHYKRNITLDELAKIASMNASSFSRFFKKNIGKSPMTYLNDVRIHMACTFLINTKHKIYEIAYDVGFQSVSHFNKLFLNFMGQTPKDYRRMMVK